MRVESIAASLGGGWTLIQRDPIGVLLPAAGLLLLQVALVLMIRTCWPWLGAGTLIALALGLSALRVLVATPMRASVLAAGARQLARPFPVWRRSPSLALVWLIGGGLEAVLVGSILAIGLVPAWWLVLRGTWWGAALLVMVALPVALLVGIAVRTLFAYAIIEATAGGRSPTDALQLGLQRTFRDLPALLGILTTGELLVALGSLLCGAGALPGLPFADLALLHRWASIEDTP